jgi:hypothetical protein
MFFGCTNFFYKLCNWSTKKLIWHNFVYEYFFNHNSQSGQLLTIVVV